LEKIFTADPMMLADLGAAQSAEIRLSLIDADSVVSRVFLAVINPASVVGRVLPLPGARLVGMNDRAGSDVLADQRDCIALARHDERQGSPHDFASDNHDLARAGLSFGEPAVNAIDLPVSGFTWPPK
jgi:hypothetical protein